MTGASLLSRDARLATIAAVALAGVLGVVLWGPIPQDQSYHRFADDRALLGIPNALDVLSNLPFLVAGWAGLLVLRRGTAAATQPWERQAWTIAFVGVALTAFGSGWYHLAPDDASLTWDRLPMTIVFMAIFAIVLGERVAPRLGALALWPLLAGGLGSIVLWRVTGDLRAYAVVQFAPFVVIVLALLLLPGRYDRTGDLWIAIGWYGLAKVLEAADRPVFEAMDGSFVSGHTLKHVAASFGGLRLAVHLRRRRALRGTGEGG